MWGNLGNLGALGKWVLQSSCTQGYAQHNGLEPPRGRGWQLIARTNTAVFLLRKNCIRVAGGSCRKKLGKAADRRVIWNPVPPDPVNNSGNTETGGNKKWGAVKKSQQMKIWERTDSWVTLVAWQQYWLSWPVSAKKQRKKNPQTLYEMNFRNGLKSKELHISHVLCWKNFWELRAALSFLWSFDPFVSLFWFVVVKCVSIFGGGQVTSILVFPLFSQNSPPLFLQTKFPVGKTLNIYSDLKSFWVGWSHANLCGLVFFVCFSFQDIFVILSCTVFPPISLCISE